MSNPNSPSSSSSSSSLPPTVVKRNSLSQSAGTNSVNNDEDWWNDTGDVVIDNNPLYQYQNNSSITHVTPAFNARSLVDDRKVSPALGNSTIQHNRGSILNIANHNRTTPYQSKRPVGVNRIPLSNTIESDSDSEDEDAVSSLLAKAIKAKLLTKRLSTNENKLNNIEINKGPSDNESSDEDEASNFKPNINPNKAVALSSSSSSSSNFKNILNNLNNKMKQGSSDLAPPPPPDDEPLVIATGRVSSANSSTATTAHSNSAAPSSAVSIASSSGDLLFSPSSILNKYPEESAHNSTALSEILQAKHNSEILEEASLEEISDALTRLGPNTPNITSNNARGSIKSPDSAQSIRKSSVSKRLVSSNSSAAAAASSVPQFPSLPTNQTEFSRIILGLGIYMEQVLNSSSKFLSIDVIQDLRLIKAKLNNIEHTLENEGTSIASTDSVELLTHITKNQWKFNKLNVDGYRAAAVNFPHAEYQYNDWHIPQYIGNFPIPSSHKAVSCNIKLPSSNNSSNQIIKITASLADTVADIISRVISNYNEAVHQEVEFLDEFGSEYVLKVIGLNEYLEGCKALSSYEYVRSCVRNAVNCEFFMIAKPPPIEFSAQEQEQFILTQSNYRNKVDSTNSSIQPISALDYQEFTYNKPFASVNYIPMAELKVPFSLTISGIDRLNQTSLPKFNSDAQANSSVLVKMLLIHGLTKITNSIKQTDSVKSSSCPRWEQSLSGSLLISELPPQTRLVFLVYVRVLEKQELIGFSIANLVDQFNVMLTGRQEFGLWPVEQKDKDKEELSFIHRAAPISNSHHQAAVLSVRFLSFPSPVVIPLMKRSEFSFKRNLKSLSQQGYVSLEHLNKENRSKLEKIISSDPLYELKPDEVNLVWACRLSLIQYPEMLTKFLLCIDWSAAEQVVEAYRLLKLWSPPVQARAALELLDIKFADYYIREYAVKILMQMPDDELQLYLLQLIQVLKYEQHHNSPLSRFLICRALQSPYIIGHHLFWGLKAEQHITEYNERFSLILEEYLAHSGPHAAELTKQYNAVQKLQRVAELIVKLKLENKYSDADCMKEYSIELEKLNNDFFLPIGKFQIPLNPKLEASTLIVEKCRFMSSKKIPLWLVFKNAEPEAKPIYIIFKSGDDLRQDMLTLQILKLMDQIWLEDNLDMRLKPYRCIATGVNSEAEGVGMIEVVMDSDTTSGIQLKFGGGAIGALKLDPLDLYIKAHNSVGPAYDAAVNNFIKSTAAYWSARN
jgi:hypothetical protein